MKPYLCFMDNSKKKRLMFECPECGCHNFIFEDPQIIKKLTDESLNCSDGKTRIKFSENEYYRLKSEKKPVGKASKFFGDDVEPIREYDTVYFPNELIKKMAAQKSTMGKEKKRKRKFFDYIENPYW